MSKRATRADLQARVDVMEGLTRQALSAVSIETETAKDGTETSRCAALFYDCADCKEQFWAAMVGLSKMYPDAVGQKPEPAPEAHEHDDDDDHPHPH